jgi:hypothetical protein
MRMGAKKTWHRKVKVVNYRLEESNEHLEIHMILSPI